LCKAVLKNLLKPKDYKFSDTFPISPQMIMALCDQVIKVLKKKPVVVNMKPPVKIFGSIHGQPNDLLRFFEKYGVPDKHAGFGSSDIEAVGYVFLGNYVDRGKHSLEVICLLLALFLKHPHEIVLLRGAHEDKHINMNEGLATECENRLKENIRKPKSIFLKLNEVFEYFPLACLVNKKVLCVPSGIGEHVVSIDQIKKIQKPIQIQHSGKISTQEKIVFDLLWSDPVQDLEENKNTLNEQRSHIAKGTVIRFGVNRIKSFMLQNSLDVLIRSHEPVREGVEKFGETNLYTVFSCTDYGGTHKNDAACLHFKKHKNQLKALIIPPEPGSTEWFSFNNLKKSFVNRSMFMNEKEEEEGIELLGPRQTVTPLRKFKTKNPGQK
jgi:protein phosphatase